MPNTAEIKIDGVSYEAPEAVVLKLKEYHKAMLVNFETAALLSRQLDTLHIATSDYKDKVEIAKEHPTKDNNLNAWNSRIDLFKLLPYGYSMPVKLIKRHG